MNYFELKLFNEDECFLWFLTIKNFEEAADSSSFDCSYSTTIQTFSN